MQKLYVMCVFKIQELDDVNWQWIRDGNVKLSIVQSRMNVIKNASVAGTAIKDLDK